MTINPRRDKFIQPADAIRFVGHEAAASAIETETLTRILLEVCNGKLPAREDTVEEGEMRRKLEDEVAAIREAGGIVDDIPPELP